MRSRIVTRAENSKITKKVINENASNSTEAKKDIQNDEYEQNFSSGLKVRTHKSIINDKPVEEIRKGYHEGRYHTTRVGRYEMGATYKGSKERITAVSVRENPAQIINITPSNFTMGVGETQVVAIKFNKPLLEDQTLPFIQIPDNLEMVVEFKLNKDRLGGTFTVKSLIEGTASIDCTCGGLTTSSRVTVTDMPTQKENTVYKDTKVDHNKPDLEVINEYIANNSVRPVNGDVFVVTLNIDGNIISLSSYIYMNGIWEAITGNVDADAVIMRKDIILAGHYDKVGNIVKGNEANVTYSAKGKSVQYLIDQIFTKRDQPEITKKPSIDNFKINYNGLFEAGTSFTDIKYGEVAKFNPGLYEYGGNTEVGVRTIVINRICEPDNMSRTNIGNTMNGTDTNEGNGFIIGDLGGNNVISKIHYGIELTHSKGSIALDNLGDMSNPIVQIQEGTLNATSNEIRVARKMFFGGLNEVAEVNSDVIRSLKSDFFESNKKFEFTIEPGTKHVIIACDKRRKGVTQIINKTALSADYTNVFEIQVKPVEGLNHYAGRDYNVWIYTPLKPFEFDTTFEVTMEL